MREQLPAHDRAGAITRTALSIAAYGEFGEATEKTAIRAID
jgi:hypothetical protein